jgi:hypothetical protein
MNLAKISDVPIYFEIDGKQQLLTPKDDITPLEVLKIVTIITAINAGAKIDLDYYVSVNNLSRHFE